MADSLTPIDSLKSRFRESFERLSSEIRQVPSSNYRPLNLEIEAVVTTVLGASPRIRHCHSQRTEFIAKC